MVLGIVDRVVGGRWSDEIGRDQLRALVHELVEGVLAVGARSSPDNGLARQRKVNDREAGMQGWRLTPVS